jgi:hypothetical protein
MKKYKETDRLFSRSSVTSMMIINGGLPDKRDKESNSFKLLYNKILIFFVNSKKRPTK